MVTIRSGSEVMAPYPRTGILKSAVVLVVMPELVIVEYHEDRIRHCLPGAQLRVLATPTTRLPAA